jgi:asparagine synthetase B (glutamine-hydrolysing)
MCGIFGISYGPGGAAAEDWSPSDFAQIMFPSIIHRGPHAYGWMSYNPASGITIEKFVGKCDTPEALATMNLDEDPKWFVGHVRYATHGLPSNLNNNHPLVHGSIVGVHNGVLRNHESILRVTGREKADTQVDSEAIFASINKWGMRSGLARIEGDMVTVFASTKTPGTLRIARSHGRPLVYATTAAGSLIFASECCVIDACGIETTTPVSLTGRNRMLTVREGRVTERVQYKADSWRNFEGGTQGIRRFYSGTPVVGPQHLPARRTSQDALAEANAAAKARKNGDKRGDDPVGPVGSTGDRYLGKGWYETSDGRTLNVDDYVDYRVEQAMATINNNERA